MTFQLQVVSLANVELHNRNGVCLHKSSVDPVDKVTCRSSSRLWMTFYRKLKC